MIMKAIITSCDGIIWSMILTPIGKSSQHGAGWERFFCEIHRDSDLFFSGEIVHQDINDPIGIIARIDKEINRN